MQKIIPNLWFDKEAVQAAEFYASVFDDSKILSTTVIKDTPSGDTDFVVFQVMGFMFMAISGGPLFKINPSVSFHAKCKTVEEVDALWEKLIDGGQAMMELGEYPFSKRYGWVQDKFGVSWQVIHTEGDFIQRITPVMMFTQEKAGMCEEAIKFYASVFPGASAQVFSRYEEGEDPDKPGTVRYGQMILAGQEFGAMDSAHEHDFMFNEGVGFLIQCKDQAEIDYYWEKLSAVPESEQCGWLKDKFGFSWQVQPENMGELIAKNPEKTTPTMLAMKKIIVADLEKAGQE